MIPIRRTFPGDDAPFAPAAPYAPATGSCPSVAFRPALARVVGPPKPKTCSGKRAILASAGIARARFCSSVARSKSIPRDSAVCATSPSAKSRSGLGFRP